ncbi:MAG: biotin--[acetyl-CoA-carboxylase] ligase [Bdellovibrionales bacterium]|nr:biotin--[acetyl-CoA-carboxylase] ligase [Bdellovibrionales bacterium]
MLEIGKISSNILSSESNVFFKDTIDSTNNFAKENFETLTYPAVVLANTQTHGRGRNTNSWTPTSNNSSLYATWGFRTKSPPSSVFPMRVGLLLQTQLKTILNMDVSLKAPNDIYMNSSKLAGILIEGIHFKSDYYTFVGIGINVLNKPNMSNVTCINDHITFSEQSWKSFLLGLNSRLTMLIDMPQNALSKQEQEALLSALKKHPSFADLQNISESGDLIYANKVLSWLDL